MRKTKTVQFGVLVSEGKSWVAKLVPVDSNVQRHLERMFMASNKSDGGATQRQFQLAEKYSEDDWVTLPHNDDLGKQIATLYDAQNIASDGSALNTPDTIKAYIAIVTENGSKKLGIKLAVQFKTLKDKPLAFFADGQLGLATKQHFKLDERWDVVTDGAEMTILNVRAFERICDLKTAILASAKAALATIAPQLSFVDMKPLEARVTRFVRSARIVADLKRRGDLSSVTLARLKTESKKQEVEYEVKNGRYIVKVGSEEDLLMLLDRRRYADPLVKKDPDIYEADSRHKVNK